MNTNYDFVTGLDGFVIQSPPVITKHGGLRPDQVNGTTLTPSCLHDITFFSLKKPRSDPYNLGTSPKICLWRSSEAITCCSSTGFPSNTSYCVIKPRVLSARKTLWPNSIGVRTLPRLMRSVWGSKIE